nr:hypothetical protein [Tanacetum cinerariifolium]
MKQEGLKMKISKRNKRKKHKDLNYHYGIQQAGGGRNIVDIDADAEVNLENVYSLDIAHEETVLISTAGGELNASNEEPVSVAPTNITTAQPSEVTKTTVDITTAPKAKGIVQSRQSDALRKYQALKRKPMSLVQARNNMMIYLKNMAGFKMDFFKGMRYEQIRPLFEEEYNKDKDQTTKKKKGDELEQDNAKKQKLEEEEEAKELKKNLEIVPDDEDDVFVNVTPLSSKPLTIVDYKIYKEGKKEHF